METTSDHTNHETQQPLPHVIYFSDDHSLSVACTANISEQFKATYSLISTWRQLGEELEKGNKFLIFHADMISRSLHSSAAEFIDAVRTMCRYMPKAAELKIGVIIKKTTPLKLVKDLQRLSVQGILLDLKEYDINEVIVAVNAFVNHIPYWPKEILNNLPGAVKKSPKLKTNSIELTHRQTQVLGLIRERGASNKAIARTLGIAESTVKLHVTEIFKKYGVRNRTQLAVFSLT